jgi:hypothetical protein
MKPLQSLSNEAPSEWGKEGGLEPKEQNPKLVTTGQRNNHVLDPPAVARSISEKERMRNMKQQQAKKSHLSLPWLTPFFCLINVSLYRFVLCANFFFK